MVKKLGAMPFVGLLYDHALRLRIATIASVEDIRPHCFRHDFGTSITRKDLDPLYRKELMGITTDINRAINRPHDRMTLYVSK